MPVFQLTSNIAFPPPYLAEENGLLAIGGDLHPKRLIEAYRQGIFPWYSEGDPLLWWFTSPRLILYTDELRISRRFARTLRQEPFTITFDRDFKQVIDCCATATTRREEGTWIVEEMRTAFIQLHNLGYAHSVECWQGSTLAGGLYGVRLDRVFFGESMCTQVSNGSKIALVALVEFLKKEGVRFIDCQMTTEHLLRFGAREISGKNFQQLLKRYITSTNPDGKWHDE